VVAHDLVILRQPDAFALVGKLKCDRSDAEHAGNLVSHAHFKDRAVRQDQHIRLRCRQPVIERHGCLGVALEAQLVELAAGVGFFDLQGVLRVVIRDLPRDLH